MSFTFQFDSGSHEYVSIATGEAYPHITQMLQDTGYVDPRWYTDESRERGSAVHRTTADYDLGLIERNDLKLTDDPKYKGWLCAHVEAMDIIQPKFQSVEEPLVHSRHLYGGRPDRVGLIYGAVAIVEIKTGAPEKGHAVQLALQAILVAEEVKLPAESIVRYGLYLKGNGRFKFDEFKDTRKDFANALEVIKRCC